MRVALLSEMRKFNMMSSYNLFFLAISMEKAKDGQVGVEVAGGELKLHAAWDGCYGPSTSGPSMVAHSTLGEEATSQM